MLTSIAFAFAAAVSWGTSDFLGGQTTRGTPVSLVLAISQSCGFVICLAALLCGGVSMPTGWPLIESVFAGLAAVVALGLLYVALTFGKSIVAAPLAASGAVIPVAAGIAHGDRVNSTAVIAIVVMLAGVMGVSSSPGCEESSADEKPRWLIVIFSVGAAAATGIYLTLIGAASRAADPIGVITALKLSAAATAIVAGWVMRAARSRRHGAGVLPAPLRGITMGGILAVGVSDAGAEILYAYASHAGNLTVASVVANLYPAFTILLSIVVLRERIRPFQGAAATAALIGVLLLASQY